MNDNKKITNINRKRHNRTTQPQKPSNAERIITDTRKGSQPKHTQKIILIPMRAQSIIIRAEMINFNLLAIVEKRRYKVACKRSGNTAAECSGRAESWERDGGTRKAQAGHRSSVL